MVNKKLEDLKEHQSKVLKDVEEARSRLIETAIEALPLGSLVHFYTEDKYGDTILTEGVVYSVSLRDFTIFWEINYQQRRGDMQTIELSALSEFTRIF